MTPYITLSARAKGVTILGAGCMYLYSLLFTFAMPVVLPSLLGRYGAMEHYALLNALNGLVTCIITPLGGKLGDRFGRRRVAILSSVTRLVLMALCAVPTNTALFFTLYLLCSGMGGILNSIPYAILGDVTTQAERPKWFGVFGTVNSIALLAGLLGGGLIVDHLGPFSAFLVFMPFGIVSTVCLVLCYPNKVAEKAGGMDKTGMLLLALGLSALILWANFGGVYFGRLSLPGVALIAAGAALLGLMARHEGRTADPVIDPRFFRNRNFLLSATAYLSMAPMICLCAGSLTTYGQVALGLSATVSGTLALPKNLIFLVLPSILGAWIAKDARRFKPVFLLCGGGIALASFFCAFWNTQTSLITVYAVMAIFGVGTSAHSVTIQPYMQRAMEPEKLGSATAVLQFANSIGVMVFNCVYSILYNARYRAATAPGGAGAAVAVAQTFSSVALLSMVMGLVICAATLVLIPRKAAQAKQAQAG